MGGWVGRKRLQSFNCNNIKQGLELMLVKFTPQNIPQLELCFFFHPPSLAFGADLHLTDFACVHKGELVATPLCALFVHRTLLERSTQA